MTHSVRITNSLIKVSTGWIPLTFETLSYIMRNLCLISFPGLAPRIVRISRVKRPLFLGVEKREPSYTAGGHVHYGEQYGGF